MLHKDQCHGFTLIELMIVIGIIAILSAIAIPSYVDYVRRGKIMEAVSGLSSLLVKVEQCYQDNHTYADCYACKDDYLGDVNDGADNFEFACDSSGALPLTATGKNSMAGFTYTVTLNSNGRESRTTNISGVSGWSAHNPNNCWVTKKGGIC